MKNSFFWQLLTLVVGLFVFQSIIPGYTFSSEEKTGSAIAGSESNTQYEKKTVKVGEFIEAAGDNKVVLSGILGIFFIPPITVLLFAISLLGFLRRKYELRHQEIISMIEKGKYNSEMFKQQKPKFIIEKIGIICGFVFTGLGITTILEITGLPFVGLGTGLIAGILVAKKLFSPNDTAVKRESE
jgi:phosphate/sulfate permease